MSVRDSYHTTPQERKKTAKATPKREVSEEMARPAALPSLEPEEFPVLFGPLPEDVLVPLGLPEGEGGDTVGVGRPV